ncbi:MAG: lytic transglycosylase domain-containing protein [Hyphomicrobiales bacterium]
MTVSGKNYRLRFIFLILGAGLFPLAGASAKPPHAGEHLKAQPKTKADYQAIARAEAGKQGVPYELVDAVMFVESRYKKRARGAAGEVGLMQVMPPTAKLLGFNGDNVELQKPENNIRLGTTYLAQAWRLGGKDICTAVMKYRAGHGETRFSVRSVNYCRKVRRHLRMAGFPITGKLPKATFGFSHRARKARGSPECFARVIQPGPNFGKCIPLSLLIKLGLVVQKK